MTLSGTRLNIRARAKRRGRGTQAYDMLAKGSLICVCIGLYFGCGGTFEIHSSSLNLPLTTSRTS